MGRWKIARREVHATGLDRWSPYQAVLVVLGLAWIAFLGVDLLWQNSPNTWPLWFLLFREGGPIEQLTWLLLAGSSLLAMYSVGRLAGDTDPAGERFWVLLSIGLVLVLIEDAGNISHRFADYLAIGIGGIAREAARLPVFGVLGGLMLYPLLRYRAAWQRVPGIGRPLLTGYVLYAIAAGLSVPFNYFAGGYEAVGSTVFYGWFAGGLAGLPEATWSGGVDRSHISFMDTAVEESLEFIAAGFLATAAWRGMRALGRPAAGNGPSV